MWKCTGCCCSRRWTLSVFGFVLLMIWAIMRDSLGVAIVSMTEKADVVTEPCHNASVYNTSVCNGTIGKSSSGWKFPWNKTEQSAILSMFFAGNLIGCVLCLGILRHHMVRYYIGGGILIFSVSTVVLPLSLSLEPRLIYALRVISGFSAAAVFPGLQSMWGRWAPQKELPKLTTFCFSGRSMGTVVAFVVTGVLCAQVRDGWKYMFYASGALGIFWFVIWQLFTAHNPSIDRFISKAERDYIMSNISIDHDKKVATPWRAIFSSRPVWGCMIIQMTCDWSDYTLITLGPTYMAEVFHFDIEQNGLLSALPHLARAITVPLVGAVAHLLVTRKLLSTKKARIVFQTIASVGSALCWVGLSFVGYTQRPLAVVLIIGVFSLQAFSESAYQVNVVEIAPRFSGILANLGNSLSGVGGLISPLIVGAMTPNKTQEEWRNCFFLVSSLLVSGLIVFLVFLDTKPQPWAGDTKPQPWTQDKDGKSQQGSGASALDDVYVVENTDRSHQL